MTVKNGKFFKGEKEVPIEHGNKEQIELLRRIHEMTEEGFSPEINIRKNLVMEFECVCGAQNEFNSFSEMDDDDIPELFLEGETDKCHNCGLKYKVISDKNQGLMLKIIYPDG